MLFNCRLDTSATHLECLQSNHLQVAYAFYSHFVFCTYDITSWVKKEEAWQRQQLYKTSSSAHISSTWPICSRCQIKEFTAQNSRMLSPFLYQLALRLRPKMGTSRNSAAVCSRYSARCIGPLPQVNGMVTCATRTLARHWHWLDEVPRFPRF